MLKNITASVAVLMVLAVAAGARAASVLVLNPSFENPSLPSDGAQGLAADWTASNAFNFNPSGLNWFSSDPLPSPGDGEQVAFTGANGQLSQIVGTVQPFTRYTLTIAVGLPTAGPPSGPFIIELLSGATVLATAPQVTPPAGGFMDTTAVTSSLLPSDPLVGGALTILIAQDGEPNQNYFDNVRLDATLVPEPASLGLLALSGVMLLRRRRAA